MPHHLNRIPVLDELRGLSILLMVLYHGLYDLVVFAGAGFPFFYSPLMRFLVPSFAGVFILISGICCRFSRSNLRRGALCLLCGAMLTCFTLLLVPEQKILFGILHLLGCCMLLAGAARPLWISASPWWALPCAVLFLLFFSLPSRGTVGLPGFCLPVFSPEQRLVPWMLFLGLPGKGLSSSDYFPLIPWAFLFFAGVLGGRALQEQKGPAFLYRSHAPFLALAGRHTLIIYLLHQPVIFLLLGLLQLLS